MTANAFQAASGTGLIILKTDSAIGALRNALEKLLAVIVLQLPR